MEQLIYRRTGNAMPSAEAELSMSEWEQLAKELFGWRTRAGYATWHGRIQALGSSNYDRLVAFAAQRKGGK